MHAFAGLESVQQTLARLIERRLVARLERRPGQKEERYAQLLGDHGEEAPPTDSHAPSDDDRLAAIEDAVAELREEVAALRSQLRGMQ
jgi:uncharacterized protein YceH (UPF0502 family)